MSMDYMTQPAICSACNIRRAWRCVLVPILCAFARQQGQHSLLVVVPRLLTKLIPDPGMPPLGLQVWQEAWLLLPTDNSEERYHNLFTGESLAILRWGAHRALAVAEVLVHFPVASLTGSGAGE